MVTRAIYVFFVAINMYLGTPYEVVGQLPICTINFDDTCPNVTPECGATFSGGEGCQVIGVANCYSSGAFSYQVAEGGNLTITLSDDLVGLSVFFAYQTEGGSGTMRFLDAGGQEVDSALDTEGPCDGPMPPTQTVFFSRPVRTIEVDNAGDDNIWIDTFEINPPCSASGDCEDGDPCTVNTCEAGNCTNTPMACNDGVACTDDSCVAGNCISTSNDSNCPDDGAFCNGPETCDAQHGCVSAGDPCRAGLFCNDQTDTCDGCLDDSDCDDGLATTIDACVAGSCVFTSVDNDCPADFDFDNDVDAADLAELLSTWGDNPGQVEDLDADGDVDAADLAELFSAWGPCADSSACTIDDVCDDGVFCNGAEVCDAESGECRDGVEPCTDLICDEDARACVECLTADDCDDGLFCRGAETCVDSECVAGSDACAEDEFCNEDAQTCEAVGDSNDGDTGEDPSQPDADGDGVLDDADQCPGTAADDVVDTGGCSDSQRMMPDEDGGEPPDDQSEDEDSLSPGLCGNGSCGAVGIVGLLWMITALGALRVARTLGGERLLSEGQWWQRP